MQYIELSIQTPSIVKLRHVPISLKVCDTLTRQTYERIILCVQQDLPLYVEKLNAVIS
jgi:hypothetical protein